jgi:PKD repeat protein
VVTATSSQHADGISEPLWPAQVPTILAGLPGPCKSTACRAPEAAQSLLAPGSSCTTVTVADFVWQPDSVEAHGLVTFTLVPDNWVVQTPVWNLNPGENDIGLALDTAGQPHIAFLHTESLQYAYYDGTTWQISTVQSSATDWLHVHISLALDTAGRPRIAYFDDPEANLKYAAWDGTNWQIEIVDYGNGPVGRYCSMALDMQDRPHISYFSGVNGDLKYAHYDGMNWQVETVESVGVTGLVTSLALDSLDHPHISYLDSTNQSLKYARYDGTDWQIAVVESAPQVGWHNSLALDAADLPYISYRDDLNNLLKHAHFDGSTWQVQTVDATQYAGGDTSLAVDAAGHPEIAYLNGYDHDLRYAYFTGAEWIIETVTSTGSVAVALALDMAARPHIAYFRAEDPWEHVIEYAWRELPFRPTPTPPVTYTWALGDGTPAAGEAVTHSYAAPGTYRVVLTATNCLTATATAVHTVTVQPCLPLSDLAFSWQPLRPRPGEWTTFTASAAGSVPIAYAWAWGDGSFSTGRVVDHSYQDAGSYTVVLTASNCATATAVLTHTVAVSPCAAAHDPDFSWQPPIIVVGEPAEFRGMARGTPPFTYIWEFGDGSTGFGPIVEHTYMDTYYYTVRMTAMNCNDDEAVASHSVPVLRSSPCAEPMEASVAVSPLRPEPGEDVQLTAIVSGTVWHTWMVDGPRGFAEQGALALDPDGRPQISYYEALNGNLRVARYDGTAWITETVDSTGDVGQYSSLALYTADNRHVVYYDATNGNLNYGWYDGTTWWYGPLDTAGDVGKYTSLDLDAGGLPHFSYYDATHGDLRYGYYNGSSWVTETVDSAGDVGLYTSLELDAAGRPHIAYHEYDGSRYLLKYAHYDGTAWLIEVVRTVYGSEGDPPSADLALDAAGRPYIAYQGERYFSYSCSYGFYCCLPMPPYPPCGYLVTYELLSLAHRDVSGWTSEDIGWSYGYSHCFTFCPYPDPTPSWRAGDVALDLDAAGYPVVFFVGGDSQIRVYRYDGSDWKSIVLSPAVNLEASMALDASGLIHAAYSGGDGKVNYAWQEISPTIPASVHWRFGDGSWSHPDQVVHHIYYDAGVYTVTAKAEGCGNWEAEAMTTVFVSIITDRAYLPLVIRSSGHGGADDDA